jgi:hypothetical protein
MTRYITPEEFKTAFLTEVNAVKSDLLARWDSPVESVNYTVFIQYTVFPNLARRLSLNYRPEFKHLDGVFFEQALPDGSNTPNAIAIALEHEGTLSSSFTEVNSLQLFNAPLKVLITYTPGDPKVDPRHSKTIRENYLKAFHERVMKSDIFRDFVTLRRFLVVIGGIREEAGEYHIDWHFYVYAASDFIELL